MALLIFANGVLAEVDWIRPYLPEATSVWAANGGSKHLFRLNHPPDRVIGDIDSLEPDVQRWLDENRVQLDRYPAEKDETDLELALLLASKHPVPEIWLFGLLGGRLDQMLANIFLLSLPALSQKKVQLITQNERGWLVRHQTEITGEIGDIVSLIPLSTEVKVTSTVGLKWPLQAESLHFGQARGVSNRLTAQKAVIVLASGLLLCLHSTIRKL